MNLKFPLIKKLKYFGIRKLYYVLRAAWVATNDVLHDIGTTSNSGNQSLIKKRVSRILLDVYNADEGHNIDKKHFFLGFSLIHYALIRNTRPNNILCVGSRMGFIPASLALACKENNVGHVDFVDAAYDKHMPSKHWGGIGFWKKQNPKKHFNHIGVSDYITTFVMTTAEYAKKNANKRYQYIYIDGDHSYDGVALDYSLFWPKLDKHGFMVFHDVIARGHIDDGNFGVWKFWNSLKNRHTVVLPFPKDSGLGIIQKI